jgi:hypothetical protein
MKAGAERTGPRPVGTGPTAEPRVR